MSVVNQKYDILLAEDNPADAVLVREALIKHGINCALRVVRDGAEAIRFMNGLDTGQSGSRLDLLVLDMHLPKHNGEEILKTLRSTETTRDCQ